MLAETIPSKAALSHVHNKVDRGNEPDTPVAPSPFLSPAISSPHSCADLETALPMRNLE